MQVKISARHGHLSENAQELIAEKTQKLLHIFERLTMIEVTVDLENDVRQVELQVQAEHKHDMVAKAEGREDLMQLVDQALHKMEGRLRRYKEKLQSHRRTPSVGDVSSSAEEGSADQE